MDCPYCGASVPDSARVCGQCGRLLSPAGRPRDDAGTTAAEARSGYHGEAERDWAHAGRVLPSNADAFAARTPAPLSVELPEPTIMDSYRHAWRQLRAHWPRLLLVVFVWMLASGALELLARQVEAAAGETWRSAFDVTGYLLFQVPVNFGLAYAILRAARGEAPAVDNLWQPFKRNYMAYILASLLATLLILVATLLLVVPGIVVAIRLSFIQFVALDDDLGPVEMVQESWRRSAGYGWTLFGMGLVSVPVLLAGLLLLLVGIVPAMMLVMLAFASLYASIAAGRGPD